MTCKVCGDKIWLPKRDPIVLGALFSENYEACTACQPAKTNYLIVKRGLYYRPQASGYTGLKRDAGRYSLEEVSQHFPNLDSPNQDGMSFTREQDASEFSPACAWDVRLVEKTRRETRNATAREAARRAFAVGASKAVETAILDLIEGESHAS